MPRPLTARVLRLTARALKALGKGLLLLLVVLGLAAGYGVSNRQRDSLLEFTDAVERFQHNPEFRQVCRDYVLLSNSALQTRPWGIPAARVVLALRSLPGLPENLALCPTSQAHYTQFTHGPLSAYLFLTGEQGTDFMLGMIEDLGRDASLTDDRARRFLSSIKLGRPVATDAGAVQSLRQLLTDVHADRPFAVRGNVRDALAARAVSIAHARWGLTRVDDLNIEQQRQVFVALDDQVRQIDPELWRTKQVNDLLCGFWGQTYGTEYCDFILPALKVRSICRIAGPVAAALLAALIVWRRRRRRGKAKPAGEPLPAA